MMSDNCIVARCGVCGRVFQGEDTRNDHLVNAHGARLAAIAAPAWMRRNP